MKHNFLESANYTAFTLRQLNRARSARFDNRAGSRLHWSYVTVLELLTRRRSLTQTNHAVEQWRARGPAKKLCTASSCLFSVYSIVAFFKFLLRAYQQGVRHYLEGSVQFYAAGSLAKPELLLQRR